MNRSWKTDTDWTDRDSEHLECFSCAVVRCGDVECAEQDVVSLSEIQSESYLDGDRIKRSTIKMRLLIVRAWAGEDLPVVSGTGKTIGEDLLKGHSWTTGVGVVLLITVGVGLLGCVCCIRSAPANWKSTTGEPKVARLPRGMTLESMRTDS